MLIKSFLHSCKLTWNSSGSRDTSVKVTDELASKSQLPSAIREPVLSDQFDSELCLMIADDYGYAEIVWYALNGKRVVEGSYGDPKLVGIYN